MTGVRFPVGAGILSLRHRFGAHPVSYPMGTGGFSIVAKRPEVKLTTYLHLVLELYLHSPIHLHGAALN